MEFDFKVTYANPVSHAYGQILVGYLMRESSKWGDSDLREKIMISFSGDSILQE